MVLPTPPFPDTTAMTLLMRESAWGASIKLSGSLFREGQLAPQVEQSWVHSSLIAISFSDIFSQEHYTPDRGKSQEGGRKFFFQGRKA
jgi:hypothetical protein